MRLRVASYNIQKAVGLDFRRLPGRIVDVICGIDADVVVLQEADRRLQPRHAAIPHALIAEQTDYRIVDLAANAESLGWHGNAILIRHGLRIEEQGRLDLPGLEPRGAVFVAFEDGPTIVGAHLGLIRRHRHKQMHAIRDHLGERAEKAVIAGDFNERAQHGFSPWRDAFDLVTPGPSFPAPWPRLALDRFAHGRSLRTLGSGVAQGSTAARASDHLPVWIDVEVKTD